MAAEGWWVSVTGGSGGERAAFQQLSARVAPWWPDLVAVHRLQFPLPLNYVVYAVWGCLYVGGLPQLGRPAAILAAVVNLLLIVGSLSLNVAADMPTDAQDRGKRPLFAAADRIGRTRVLAMSTGELATAAGLALVIGLVWGRWFPAVCALALIATQLAYNIEPLRLKKRGLIGSVAFGIAPVGPPFVLSYTALESHIDLAVWLIALGVSTISVGRTIWWAVPDMPADAATGMKTPVVRYGPPRGLALGCGGLMAGILALGAGMWLRYNIAWCLAGIAGHAALLAIIGWSLVRHVARGDLSSARRVMGRTQLLITLGDAMVAVVALAA